MSHKHHRNVRWTTRTVYFYSAQKQLRFAALWSSFAPPFSTEAVVIINANHSTTPLDASIVPSTTSTDSRFPGPQYMRLLGNNLLEALGVQFPVPGAPNDVNDPGGVDGLCVGDGSECFPFATTIRISNIRVNASVLALAAQVDAIVSMTGPTTIPVFPNVLNIALPLIGLTWEVDGAPADDDSLVSGAGLLCETDSRHPTITLSEGFATSFKIIGVPTFTPGNTQVESGYFSPGSGATGGGATQGTRFKIWFLNVPTGVDVSVPTSMNNSADVTLPTPLETNDCSDPSNWDSDALCLHLISGADASGAGGSPVAFGDGMTSVDIDSDGMGMVVYEVFDGNPFVTEACTLTVWFEWDEGAADPGSAQIVVNFAPIATGLEDEYSFVADDVSPRPRFINTGPSPEDAFSLRRCTTTLLFPWVTNQAGFDTGIAVSNTSKDWLDTPNQSGICTVHWHGANSQGRTFPDTPSGVIDVGEQFIFLVSTEAPDFQGYVIVLCEFQFAHGFAFITDGFGGVTTIAQGYLALVLDYFDKFGTRIAPEALEH